MPHGLLRQAGDSRAKHAVRGPPASGGAGVDRMAKEVLPPLAGTTPGRQRCWWERLAQEVVAEEVIEPRRPRVNPRVLKRTAFDFPKKKPRDRRPQPDTPANQKACFILRRTVLRHASPLNLGSVRSPLFPMPNAG